MTVRNYCLNNLQCNKLQCLQCNEVSKHLISASKMTDLLIVTVIMATYGIGQAIIFSSCGFFFLSFFFSSPILRGLRLDVYHTSTHDVALVQI